MAFPRNKWISLPKCNVLLEKWPVKFVPSILSPTVLHTMYVVVQISILDSKSSFTNNQLYTSRTTFIVVTAVTVFRAQKWYIQLHGLSFQQFFFEKLYRKSLFIKVVRHWNCKETPLIVQIQFKKYEVQNLKSYYIHLLEIVCTQLIHSIWWSVVFSRQFSLEKSFRK